MSNYYDKKEWGGGRREEGREKRESEKEKTREVNLISLQEFSMIRYSYEKKKIKGKRGNSEWTERDVNK